MSTDKVFPVDLLRDGKGVYGIGAIETEHSAPLQLILRCDRISEAPHGYAALQKIAGGFRRGPCVGMGSEQFRRIIHHEALRRSGLLWPRVDYWLADPQQRVRNRQIYHGL